MLCQLYVRFRPKADVVEAVFFVAIKEFRYTANRPCPSRIAMSKRVSFTLSLAASMMLASPFSLAQPLQLISPSEAQMPAMAQKPASRAITRGPGVKLLSSETVSGHFPLKIAFEPRGSSKIDPASVKVEYLKGNGVDITDRLKAAVKGNGIELADAQAPAGEHPIKVSVRDDEGRQGSLLVNLVVK